MRYDLLNWQGQVIGSTRERDTAIRLQNVAYENGSSLQLSECREDGDVRYVNAYDCNRAYGGPEEGGWWFDTGVLLASVPVTTQADEDTTQLRLRAIFWPRFEGNHNINSVLCEGQLSVCVEDELGHDYPTHRPHYE